MNILEVKNISLCKTFQGSGFSLDNISFTVPKGAIVGLAGEGGSGKTALLDIILGLTSADDGDVSLFGRKLTPDDTETRAKIGVMFDTNYFPNYFANWDISKIFSKIYKNWDARYFLSFLENYEIRDHSVIVKNMAQGTKSILAIATALAVRPELLILD